jgi:hypothetical protein
VSWVGHYASLGRLVPFAQAAAKGGVLEQQQQDVEDLLLVLV